MRRSVSGVAGVRPDRARAVRDLAAVIALGTSVAAIVTAEKVAPAAIGGYGLISVVPFLFWLALAALVVSFALHVSAPTLSAPRLAAHVVAWVLLLHGLPSFLEHEPPFPSAWVTAGLVQAFIKHGHPYDVDARFFWPGFFTAIGTFVGMNGWKSALPMLRWTPVISNLFYAVPIFVIARLSLRRKGAPWIVVWLFVALNWVGQDYFSPQGFAYFLFLAIVAVLVASFARLEPGQLPHARRVRDWLDRRRLAARWEPRKNAYLLWWAPSGMSLEAGQATAVLAILLLGSVALTMAHQLTPVALALDVTALVLARRCRLTFLPAILIALGAAWVSFAAIDYWSGHIAELFGSGGSSTVSAGLSNRLVGSSAHLFVVYLRVFIALGVWILAVAACVRSGVARRPINLTILILALAPFPVLALQSYGGEAPIRLYLYTLPFMICLVVDAISRSRRRWTWRGVLALSLGTALLVPAFLVARFGNEIFEQVRPDEIVAADALYRLAPKGSTLAGLMSNGITWQFKDFADYTYDDTSDLTTPSAVLREIGKHSRPAFLIVTTGEIAYAVNSYGLPANWGTTINHKLAASPYFKLIYSNPDARIYSVRSSLPSPRPAVRKVSLARQFIHQQAVALLEIERRLAKQPRR